MTFVWQCLDVSDVSATDLVEFPKKKKNGKIPICEGCQNCDQLLKLCKLSDKGFPRLPNDPSPSSLS